jgi:hypothetical protein
MHGSVVRGFIEFILSDGDINDWCGAIDSDAAEGACQGCDGDDCQQQQSAITGLGIHFRISFLAKRLRSFLYSSYVGW